jgi:hypothetical protein
VPKKSSNSCPQESKTQEILDRIKYDRIECQKLCKDKSIPLDKRWKTFLQIGPILGKQECFVRTFKSLPKGFVQYDGDYLHAERYTAINVAEIAERILEINEEGELGPIDFNKFAEEVLQNFIWSFVYDW